jgi:hypothetical protein
LKTKPLLAKVKPPWLARLIVSKRIDMTGEKLKIFFKIPALLSIFSPFRG